MEPGEKVDRQNTKGVHFLVQMTYEGTIINVSVLVSFPLIHGDNQGVTEGWAPVFELKKEYIRVHEKELQRSEENKKKKTKKKKRL
jgi:hypothetical protein